MNLKPEFSSHFVDVFRKCQFVSELYYDLLYLPLRYASQSGVQFEIFLDRHLVDKCIKLRTVADMFPRPSQMSSNINSSDEDISSTDCLIPCQHLKRRGLPSSIDAEESEAFSSWNLT